MGEFLHSNYVMGTENMEILKVVIADDEVRICQLIQALIDWRREKYRQDNVPAYIILHQKTLLAIADLAPATREELLTVKGFGKSKCDKYGDEILDVIRQSLKNK